MESESASELAGETRRTNRQKKSLWSRLGPGLITGASDDDPSGIATYTQAGAAFGYGLLWTMVFSLPLMTAIQEISARIGRVSGHGLAGNLRRYYSRWLLYPIVSILLITNTINIGADIGAMGDAARLLIGGSALLYAILFAAVTVLLEVFGSYQKCSSVFKGLSLVLFSYVFTTFLSHVHWSTAFKSTILPRFEWNKDYWATFVALFGTTISPYLFFWQASLETEEIHKHAEEKALKKAPKQAKLQFGRIRLDTYVGMGFSNVVAFFIIVAAAATLNAHRVKDIQTSAQAAEALRPIAGNVSVVLFSLGIIGTGLLAVPVLAGSAAYAAGHALKWRTGISQKPTAAKGFYSILTLSTALGLAINLPAVQHLTHLTPIKALFWAAVVNGVAAVPIMVIVMLMARNKQIMGRFKNASPLLQIVGWIATAVMAAAAILMMATLKASS